MADRNHTRRREWSGGAMVLGKLPLPGRPTIWITVGQGPTALAIGAGWGLFGHFYSHLSFLSPFSLSLGDAPYRLKHCLKGPLNPKQPIIHADEKVVRSKEKVYTSSPISRNFIVLIKLSQS